ncbi:hypothetical protein ACHAWF_006046 [Thalassiosira exigua]
MSDSGDTQPTSADAPAGFDGYVLDDEKAGDDGPRADDFGFLSWPGGKYGMNFGTHESPKDIVGDSAYAYFLVPNLWSFLVALVVVAFQLYLFWLMWDDAGKATNADFRETESEFVAGLVGASFMIILRVLPDIGRGLELLAMGAGITLRFAHLPEFKRKRFDAKLLFVAVVDLLVSVGCVCVGVRFSLNKAVSVLRTITSATVAVFIAGIDESTHKFLAYWGAPTWLLWAESQVEKKYGSRPDESEPAPTGGCCMYEC